MAVEDIVKEILQQVLDVKPEEIKEDESLVQAFGVDSTEMVEINVALKKALNVDIENNTLSKGQSFNEIVEVLKNNGAV